MHVLAYLRSHYPKPGELSGIRLLFGLYLADWKSALEHEEQMTDLDWYKDHGPEPRIDDDEVQEYLDNLYNLVDFISDVFGDPSLIDDRNAKILDFVIETIDEMPFDELVQLVYSTYPMITGASESRMDLPQQAQKYRVFRQTAFAV